MQVGIVRGHGVRVRDRHGVYFMIYYPFYHEGQVMNITYRVLLTAAERDYLEAFTSQGRQRVRALKRAQVLLLADGGVRREEEIVEALGVSTSTVYRVKRDFVEYGLEAALREGVRPGRPAQDGSA